MKVKSYFAIIIIACLSCGVLLELIITSKQSEYQSTSNQVIVDQFTLGSLKRFQHELSQYFISVDLILGSGETNLVNGALKKGQLLIDYLYEYIIDSEASINKELIEQSEKDIILINDLIKQSQKNINKNQDEYLVELLDYYDDIASRLNSNVISLIDQTNLLAIKRKAVLVSEKSQLSQVRNMGTIVFGAILLFLWVWGYRGVCDPIHKLKNSAEASMNNLNKFKGISHGPKEIIELSKSLSLLTTELSYQVSHDSLTDIPNRREFERKLNKRISDLKNEKNQGHDILCYLDLDKFKIINDACGHDAGDELLKIIAKLINNIVRKSDFIARLGSDEFCIILYKCNMDTAVDICTKVRDEIENIRYEWEERTFRTSVSIGILEINNPLLTAHDLLNITDTTCSVAKELGGNRIHIFSEIDTEFARKKMEMSFVNRIYSALEEDRFILYRQNIVPLTGIDEGEHFEILIRLITKEGKLIGPSEFLPAVERYRLATQLDQWVVINTFKILSSDSYNLDELEICNINLSGQSFSNLHMADFIIENLIKENIPAHKICFEITETAAVTDISNAQKFITKLKSHGCLFALDDFGSGFSSFQYLKSLPVDFIKIDGAFIQNIATDNFDQTTVKSINEIAKAMGQQTVAEFVDSIEVVNMLNEIGIDYAQGYYFDKPVPLAKTYTSSKKASSV